MHKIDRWFSENGEAFTRKPLVFSEVRPKSDEVKAKNEKRLTRACTRAYGGAEVGDRCTFEKSASDRCSITPNVG